MILPDLHAAGGRWPLSKCSNALVTAVTQEERKLTHAGIS